ncbi:MAG: hypothetical protein A2010_15675 [Nitrospirae bacterium GWD2_57_9]|nr:MAG: hypothetical protein A2010_15675 [Nitrospirae bacterium GWD2_57_9]OGW47682.1 MAG: hypothetical protein A2078_05245 [Nitrospirae bacterium GWC2_57_9]
MEVRCTGCNKLFRVSDDKILASGVKFGCTRCGNTVKITREDFERYLASRSTTPALASVRSQAAHDPVAAPVSSQPSAASDPDFDLSDPATAAAAMHQDEAPPAFVMPDPVPARPPETAPVQKQPQKAQPSMRPPAPGPRTEVRTPPKPRPEPVRQAPAAGQSASAPPVREAARPAAVLTAAPVETGGSARKFVLVVIALLILGGAAVGVKSFVSTSSEEVSDAINSLQLPEGLQILNASGAVDPVNGDLIVNGVVENTTDKPKPAWYIVVDVYDAQNAVLTKGKLLSGKQLYTKRDLDIMEKRGVSIQELKLKMLQEQGIIIPAKESVTFEIRIMEPPQGMASFNATLQPFDPVQIFKEMAEGQK